jgi:hypothetical protein
MKLRNLVGWSSALCLGVSLAQAQETNDAANFERMFKQMQQKQEDLERMVREQKAEIEALKRRVEVNQTNAVAASKVTPNSIASQQVTTPVTEISAPDMAKPWTPASPIGFGSAQNYINLSFDGLFTAGGSTAQDVEALEFGGHDPKQNGFTVQNLELTLEGKVDPYFRGQANIVLQIDSGGETTIEAEEAYLETVSLPWNLQVKAGQYFTQFGRINPTHPHTWDFVDQPLVIGRFLGPDGLRNPGGQVSWLTPTPFYSELFLSVQDSQGETASSFRDVEGTELITQRPGVDTSVEHMGDLLYVPRYVMSFNLTDEHTVMLGGSGAFGPNASGQDGRTAIYGADLFYKWKSRNHHRGFPFVTWQTEWLYSHYRAQAFPGDAENAAFPAETFNNWGMYSQVSYGFHPGWVASLRGDYVTGQPGDFWTDPLSNDRYRFSPALTFYPSEFSKIRLQYNYDHIQNTGGENSVWLQFEFLLGSHAAHKF